MREAALGTPSVPRGRLGRDGLDEVVPAFASFSPRRQTSQARAHRARQRLRDRGFEAALTDEGNQRRQTWKLHEERITVDFLIGPTSEGARPGRIQDLESDFAAIVTPALPLAFIPAGHPVQGDEQAAHVTPRPRDGRERGETQEHGAPAEHPPSGSSPRRRFPVPAHSTAAARAIASDHEDPRHHPDRPG